MDYKWVTASDVDEVLAAAHLFDDAPRKEWTQRFLDEATHHLCFAYVDGEAAGFISGVEVTHPDKGTEMFLYELSVGEPYRRRGIGTALVRALASRARDRGCYGMWVGTEDDNEAALRTYIAGGATDRSSFELLEWRFGRPPRE